MPDMIEEARRTVVKELFGKTRSGIKPTTFKAMWDNKWKAAISNVLLSGTFPESAIKLGSMLSGIFSSTGIDGRKQSSLSGGGAAWESLVAWYANLCLAGSTAIVFKKHSHLPSPIRDALNVSYMGVDSNKEADLVAVTFPSPFEEMENRHLGLNELSRKAFGSISVSVIQCKTNWNDNSQIPMLWNLLYQTLMVARVDGVRLGRNGFSLSGLKSFSYAFVTVPTNDAGKISPTSLPARRLQNLTGGNYWGRESRKGVARSAFEMFGGAMIGPENGTGVRDLLSQNKNGIRDLPDYFNLQ